MANFNPPFSADADRRYPTSDERNSGFPCGPAERELFNGLLHRVESEIGNVITSAGLIGSDADLTQLRQAIQAMIDAATGSGATANYLLMAQARSRLPIFPEINTVDGTMTCISPVTGSVRVPGGIIFTHRGIFPITTSQTDFTTEANKTYHIRWTVTDGIVFKSLSDVAYNPSTLSESNAAFDSKYDDMLIARVITNTANIATITNMVNKDRLFFSADTSGAGIKHPTNNYAYYFDGSVTINWARTPKTKHISGSLNAASVQPGGTLDGGANLILDKAVNRYAASAQVFTDWQASTMTGVVGRLSFDFSA